MKPTDKPSERRDQYTTRETERRPAWSYRLLTPLICIPFRLTRANMFDKHVQADISANLCILEIATTELANYN